MKTLSKRVLPATVAMLIGGQLYAQPTTPIAEPAVSGDVSVTGTVGVTTVDGAKLSSTEMKQHGDELAVQVRVDMQHVLSLQALARKEQDIIKLSCVNDKFVKLKAEANLFDTAQGDLIGSLEVDQRFAIYPRVSTSAHNVHVVREEADRCVGKTEVMSESQSTYSHPDIPDDPTTGGLPLGTIVVEDPGYASPYN